MISLDYLYFGLFTLLIIVFIYPRKEEEFFLKSLPGSKKRSKINTFFSFLLRIFLCILLLAMLVPQIQKIENTFNHGEQKDDNGQDEGVATTCAQYEVAKNLKSPSTADFPWSLNATSIGKNKYIIKNYVDSQNAFGAIIRTNYVCTVEVLDSKNLSCKSSCVFQ